MFSDFVGVLDCSSTLLSLRAITIEPSDTIESLIVLIFRLTVEILCPTFVAKIGRVQYILILEFFETKITFYSEFFYSDLIKLPHHSKIFPTQNRFHCLETKFAFYPCIIFCQ